MAGLAFAAPGQASHKDFRFGVSGADFFDAAEVARMGAGDVGVMRIDFQWRDVEPVDNGDPYDWSKYDNLMRQTSVNGVPVLPVIIGSPRDVALKRHPPTTDVDITRYKSFVKALVRRYGRDGSFWCDSPDPIPVGCAPVYRPITEWQVWNEPSLEAYWTNSDPNPKEYAKFLEISRTAIERGDDQATVVMAGLPEFTGAGMDLKPYLTKLYDVDGIKQQFDVVALHPFAANEAGVKGALSRLRDLMDKNGDESTPIWITEVGWGTDGTSSDRDRGFVKSRSGQANVLRDTFEMTQNKRNAFTIGSVVWFSWRDARPPGKNNFWYFNAGLFEYQSGEPKPSWPMFVSFTGGNPGSGPLPPPIGTTASATSDSALTASPSAERVEPSPRE